MDKSLIFVGFFLEQGLFQIEQRLKIICKNSCIRILSIFLSQTNIQFLLQKSSSSFKYQEYFLRAINKIPDFQKIKIHGEGDPLMNNARPLDVESVKKW